VSGAKGGTFSKQSEENLGAVPRSQNTPIAGSIQFYYISDEALCHQRFIFVTSTYFN